jgi:D-amino-acid dehydrogenase
MPGHIAIIGAGIVGITTAIELRARGHDVTVIGRDAPGSRRDASFGNAGWLSPGSVVPMSTPGMWRKVPQYLLDPRGPLTIRPSVLPAIAPWLLRFTFAGATERRARRIAAALSPFLRDAAARHAALAARIGAPELIVQDGLLIPYRDRAAYEADAFAWSLRRENGVNWTLLEGEALRSASPGLSKDYTLGAFLPDGGHCANPGGYVAALAAHATRQRVVFHAATLGRVRARAGMWILDCGARQIACDQVVVAAGLNSGRLARRFGDRIPLVAERGYHVQTTTPMPTFGVPVMPGDLKIGVTPMQGGLRAAGQVEFAPRWRRPSRARAEIVRACLKIAVPDVGDASVTSWMGNRPSTPDCLPAIGPSRRAPGVFYATGHGHLGLVSAPLTAELIADMIDGRPPGIDVQPYDPGRFKRLLV